MERDGRQCGQIRRRASGQPGDEVPWLGVGLAVAAPALTALLWGSFAAPTSPKQLGVRARLPFELLVFALAVAGLPATGSLLLAIVFAATVCGNAGLLTVFRQWEQ
jgi:hypothetical protein